MVSELPASPADVTEDSDWSITSTSFGPLLLDKKSGDTFALKVITGLDGPEMHWEPVPIVTPKDNPFL